VVPGKYTIEFTTGGKTLRQPLTVELDPRVHASQDDLIQQRDLALQIVRGMKTSHDAFARVTALKTRLQENKKVTQAKDAKSAQNEKADPLEKKLESLEKGTSKAPGFGPINRDLGRLISSVESADIRPTQAVRSAVQQLCDDLDKNLQEFQDLSNQEIKGQAETPLPKSGCGE
jgi:hypothetical protein